MRLVAWVQFCANASASIKRKFRSKHRANGFGAGQAEIDSTLGFAGDFGGGCSKAFGLGACTTQLACKLRWRNLSHLSFILRAIAL